mmetsp:Transcript_17623/g.39747  ORF Transcript_17623/g.39747 Transcript_17623/m.39747 type:complete len:328 (+) Transcript_17623:312-1295(+)
MSSSSSHPSAAAELDPPPPICASLRDRDENLGAADDPLLVPAETAGLTGSCCETPPTADEPETLDDAGGGGRSVSAVIQLDRPLRYPLPLADAAAPPLLAPPPMLSLPSPHVAAEMRSCSSFDIFWLSSLRPTRSASTTPNASERTSFAASRVYGTTLGRTLSATSLWEKYSLHEITARRADSRQGVNGSFIALVNAGRMSFCLLISVRFGAIFPINITVFVRMLASGSACILTRYLVSFSRLVGFSFGTRTTVDLSVSSRSGPLESVKPEHIGSKTLALIELLSIWLSSRDIFCSIAPRTPLSFIANSVGTSGVTCRAKSSGELAR